LISHLRSCLSLGRLNQNLKQEILEAAEKRLWSRGFRHMTIEEIAMDANTAKGTIYLYFSSKEDILLALLSKFKTEISIKQKAIYADTSLSIEDRIRKVIKTNIQSAYEKISGCKEANEFFASMHPRAWSVLEPYINEEEELITNLIDEGGKQGIFRVDNAKSAAKTLKCALKGYLPPHVDCFNMNEVNDEIDSIINMALKSFRA
jgi:AcrR family transcriptional regulator